MLRLLVVDLASFNPAATRAALLGAGCDVAAVLTDGAGLAAAAADCRPDLVLVDAERPDAALLAQLAALHRDEPRPVVLFTRDDAPETIREALRSGVCAYVVEALEGRRVKAAIAVARARFEDYQALRRELDEFSRKLAERKLLEKAKGLLMKARGLDEEGAYHALRRLAMERSQPMAAVAQDVIAMARLLL